jgi:amino acid transporter
MILIPMGLAASTISSALGSIMVAPRTLQALGRDRSFPFKGVNRWLAKGRTKDHEPVNASIVTCIIAVIVVAIGNINMVASIISMFFMVTYGALCLISFLNHFGSSPSYRPSFRSRWYISLTGFLVAVWVMFKISTPFALLSIVLIVVMYLSVRMYHRGRDGLEAIFANAIFQLNRNLQIYLQRSKSRRSLREWRPSVICISKDSFTRTAPFELLNWISYKYGFGTYLHLMEGYYSKATHEEANQQLKKLISRFKRIENHVYVDTLISPSYTSAIAQAIQIPGIAGMENNMVIFEYDKEHPENLPAIIDNFALVHAGKFDVCILGSSQRLINRGDEIHIWIRNFDTENSNLMIMLGFIILGHPFWNKSNIRIFNICKPEQREKVREELENLLVAGRLPITINNIEVISNTMDRNVKELICKKSEEAGLVIVGLRDEAIRHEGIDLFSGYERLGSTVFVNSVAKKKIK